jgi:hypothetical protein
VDGRMHRYFFWDAWYKKLIDRTIPLRKAGMAELFEERKSSPKFFELRTGAQLDSLCYYNDMWNALTYTEGGTIWNRVCHSNSFKPRRLLADNEPQPPSTKVRHARADRQQEVERFKRYTGLPPMERDANGQWVVPPGRAEEIRKDIDVSLPNEELRRRTVAIVTKFDPSVMASMTQDQREQMATLFNLTGKQIEASGLRCIRFDDSFTEDDYADYVHLTASGGEKMAAKVAPAIRELAASLGYHEQSGRDGSRPAKP